MSAQRYIAANLEKVINSRETAQAVGISVTDLKASFRFVLQQDFKDAILSMRLKKLHALMEEMPEQSLEQLAGAVGLTLDEEIGKRFNQAFWVTPERWHQLCRSRLRLRRSV